MARRRRASAGATGDGEVKILHRAIRFAAFGGARIPRPLFVRRRTLAVALALAVSTGAPLAAAPVRKVATFSARNVATAYAAASNLVARCTPRDPGTLRARLAANCILDAAASVGASPRLDTFRAKTPAGMRQFTNVVAEWKGAGDDAGWILILSHYDTKPFTKCPGANDGASTTGLLVGLAEVFADMRKPPLNVALLWLDGEECMYAYGEDDGLWGSRHAAAAWKASGRRVSAVICLDMLGDPDLNISLPRNTSPELRRRALAAAKLVGREHVVKEIREAVKDDHVPFADAGFKTVNLIDFDYGSAPGLNDYWHSPNDTMAHVSKRSLAVAGAIVCEMVNSIAGLRSAKQLRAKRAAGEAARRR